MPLCDLRESARRNLLAWASELVRLARPHLSIVLIVTGFGLLAFVGVEYGQMYLSQRELQRQWAEQQRRHALAPVRAAGIDDGLTRLSIPKIDLTAVVVEGTNRRSLLLGPGHLEDTVAPGEIGNSVISAHRDTFFRRIYELQKGDEVLVQRRGRTYKYEVIAKRIVEPSDVSVVKPSNDARLTLITCYPTYYIGPAPERLVITSRLIDDADLSSGDTAPTVGEKASQHAISH